MLVAHALCSKRMHIWVYFCWWNIVSCEWISVPEDQMRSYATGLKRPLAIQTGSPVAVITDIPSSLDWRNLSGSIPVRDKGGCGSCWAFATIAPLEFMIQKLTSQQGVDLSEQFFVQCNDMCFSCAAGGWWAFDKFRTHGMVPESCAPYRGTDGPCTVSCEAIPGVAVLEWGYVDRYGGIPSIEAMKSVLLRRGPLAVAVSVGN